MSRAGEPSTAHLPAGRGRPPHKFWPEVENYLFDLLVRYGLPGPNNPKLPNKTKLEMLAAKYLEQNKWSAAESGIRRHVVDFLAYWEKRGPSFNFRPSDADHTSDGNGPSAAVYGHWWGRTG
jgi:hypothetical protein